MSNNLLLFQPVLPTSGATTVTRTAPPLASPVTSTMEHALPASQPGLERSVSRRNAPHLATPVIMLVNAHPVFLAGGDFLRVIVCVATTVCSVIKTKVV